MGSSAPPGRRVTWNHSALLSIPKEGWEAQSSAPYQGCTQTSWETVDGSQCLLGVGNGTKVGKVPKDPSGSQKTKKAKA